MKNKTLIFLLLAGVLFVSPLIVAAQPNTAPPGGNVNARFNSVIGSSIPGFDMSGVLFGSVFAVQQTGLNPAYGNISLAISDNTAYGIVSMASSPFGSAGQFSDWYSGTTAELATADGYVLKAQGFSVKPNGDVYPNGATVPVSNMLNSFGKYVGQTSGSTNGNIGGYAAAQALCNAVKAGSHVCTAKEITNSYELNPTGPISTASGNAWINNGPPAYISDLSNDCQGWKSNENPADGYSSYGSTWKFSTKTSLISHCSRSLPVACCSYAQ